MPVPDVQKLLLPVLKNTADGQPHRPADTLQYVLSQLDLTPEEISDRLPNGRTRLMDRVLWAITYLRKASLIESISWSVFQITDRGRKFVSDSRSTIAIRDLEIFPEFLEFRRGNRLETAKPADAFQENAASAETPNEQLQKIFQSITQALENDLLDAFKAGSPTFFEKVVVQLLVAMGYGGTIEDAGQTTKTTGDDGVDGVIKEDRLGLDVIHIQAKRWADKVVGRPDVQNFAGSLEGQRGRKGVFITTSSFSNDAKEYVSRIEKRIILIDGARLAKLCVQFGIGVLDESTLVIKKIDSDFFEEA